MPPIWSPLSRRVLLIEVHSHCPVPKAAQHGCAHGAMASRSSRCPIASVKAEAFRVCHIPCAAQGLIRRADAAADHHRLGSAGNTDNPRPVVKEADALVELRI